MIATVNADRIANADKFSQVPFEVTQLLAQDQIAFGESIGDSKVDFTFHSAVMLAGIDKRHTVGQMIFLLSK